MSVAPSTWGDNNTSVGGFLCVSISLVALKPKPTAKIRQRTAEIFNIWF